MRIKILSILSAFSLLNLGVLSPIANAAKPSFTYNCFYHYASADSSYSGNSYIRIYPSKTLGGTTNIYYYFLENGNLLGNYTGTKSNNFYGSYETYNVAFPSIDLIEYSIIGGGGKKILENGFIDLNSCLAQ